MIGDVNPAKVADYIAALQTLLSVVVNNLPEETVQAIIRDANLLGKRLAAERQPGAQAFRELAADMTLTLAQRGPY